ncbi:MAG: DUF3078 domain-containing protein [Schleiferiaceae bacterium]
MKKFLLAAGLAIFTLSATAQDEPDTTLGWKYNGLFSLSASQLALENWNAGGDPNITASLIVKVAADKKGQNYTWANLFETNLGLIDKSSSREKTEDRIEFTTRYDQRLFENKKWALAALGNFKTQYLPGYTDERTIESEFMSPGYVLAGIGFTYAPNDNFTAYISPITNKNTIVNNDSLANLGEFGVDPAIVDTAGNILTPGANVRYEAGAYINVRYQKAWLEEKYSLVSKLELYSNYIENPENIDVNWETVFLAKVNKWLTVNFVIHLIYDHDILVKDTSGDGINNAPALQYKQGFGVGLSYTF